MIEEYEYEYEQPVTAREGYDFHVAESDMDTWLSEIAESGI